MGDTGDMKIGIHKKIRDGYKKIETHEIMSPDDDAFRLIRAG